MKKQTQKPNPETAKNELRRKASASSPISLRIQNDHLERIEKLAHRLGVSQSVVIKLAIAEMLERNSV